jgi:exosortase J
MSAIPHLEASLPIARSRGLSPVQFSALGITFVVLGLSTIWPAMTALWVLWTTDALKSVGTMIPLVSLVLILRVWRTQHWQAEGTWWGLAVLLIPIVASRLQQEAILILVVSPHWSTVLPPPSLVLFAYGSGVVLLLGGVPLYRAALFPIILLLFANPVPHVFSLLVDLPLQRVSAYIARDFAMALGQPLTPDHLRLMFTPDFGMFIAPGCNGIRGSLTMGLIALIAGYVYRFRWYANGLVVMGAVLLGYVFNLARLCLLVLYYVIALHFTSLQNKAENADYLIGAALFLLATLFLFTVIHRLRDAKKPTGLESTVLLESCGCTSLILPTQYARLAAMGVMALLGCASLVRASAATHLSTTSAGNTLMQRFPSRIGNYTLVRSWNETLLTGPVVYVWAQYAPIDGGTSIAIGVSPMLGWHDPLICHAVRGEHPLWQGPLTVATADVAPINFSSAFYSNGVAQYIEASTQCSGTSCGEFATERTHFGFIFSRPDPKSVLSQNRQWPIPVLLRAESMDMAMPADAARQQLTQNLRLFLASVSLDDLTRPYSR